MYSMYLAYDEVETGGSVNDFFFSGDCAIGGSVIDYFWWGDSAKELVWSVGGVTVFLIESVSGSQNT